MNNSLGIRHVVSIGGVVREPRADGGANGQGVREYRIQGALVEILDGPPAFETMRNAQAEDPAWHRLRERIDRTRTQADGVFYFLDLPEGNYNLRISVPEMGTRYGAIEIESVAVPAAPVGEQVQFANIDVDLSPTRIHGVVQHADTGEPIAGAKVRLRGDTNIIRTNDSGQYDLTRLVAGNPSLEVTAANFEITRQVVPLQPGQDQEITVTLTPL